MKVRAAWEWRGFRRVENDCRLMELAAPLAEMLGLELPDGFATVDDTYLVLPGMCHNWKLRRGALEVKLLLARQAGGYSLWAEKQVMGFPLSRPQIAWLWSLLPAQGADRPFGAPGAPPETVPNVTALVEALRSRYPDLSMVPVRKHRLRIVGDDARLELVGQELPRGYRLLSICVDGYALQAVQDLVRRGQLDAGSRLYDWVAFLQDAVWWVPSLVREESQW